MTRPISGSGAHVRRVGAAAESPCAESDRLGNYRILELLGRGGMGQVFLAEHVLLEKRVAIKVLGGDRSDEFAGEQFLREARAAAAVEHPNIVRVLDVNVAHDPPFLVMEYVDGISLQAAVVRYGSFSPEEAAAVGVQVALGLQQAARVGLVHRDIKPANVLIDRKGGVKILDLGIARFSSDPEARAGEAQSVIGTLDYLAPEQAIDSSLVDSRADLYSLGATLFFLLAGHPPFADDEADRKIIRKQQSNPPSLVAMGLEIPEGLAAVINRLLARSASDRYATPDEAAQALQPFASWEAGFPDRLFQSSACEESGEPLVESEPPLMQLPPTRRITRLQTERPLPLPDTTPMPKASLLPIEPGTAPRRPSEPLETVVVLNYAEDESGSPTEPIFPANRKPSRVRAAIRRLAKWCGITG